MKKTISAIILISFAVMGFNVNAQNIDVSVITVKQPGSACTTPTNVTVEVTLFNPQLRTVKPPYSVMYVNRTTGDTVTQAALANDSIQAFMTRDFKFSTAANVPNNQAYEFYIEIIHPNDTNSANDTINKTVVYDANTVGGRVDTAKTVCINANAGTVYLSGQLGTMIAWIEAEADGDTNTFFVGSSDTTRSYLNLDETTAYAAVVRNGVCPFDTSIYALIQVDSATDAGVITGGGSICVGSSGNLVVTNFDADTLWWESALNPAGPWTDLSNSNTTQAYTNVTTGDDTLYRVIAKLGVCPEDTSYAELNLDSNSIGGIVNQTSGNDTVCAAGNSVQFTLTNQVGNVLRWEESILGGSFDSIPGTAGQTVLNRTNVPSTRAYRAIVQNGTCTPIPSASFTLTVDSITIGGTIGTSTTVCTGTNSGTLNLTGQRGDILYWVYSEDGGSTWDTILPFNTTPSQGYSGLTTTRIYRAWVKNGTCAALPSSSATITVSSPTVGGTITTGDPTTVCAPTNTGLLTYSGGNGAVVDWEVATGSDSTSFSAIGNLISTYTYSNLDSTSWFRVQVQNAPCLAEYSDTIRITVLPQTVPGNITGTNQYCEADTANLSLTGEDGTVTTWQKSTDAGANFFSLTGTTGLTSISDTVNSNSVYRAIVQNGTCVADTTANFVVGVDPATVPGSVASAATVCGANNGDTLVLSGHVGDVNDWLYSEDNGASWFSVPGLPVTVPTYFYDDLTVTTDFRALVQSGVCPQDSSSTVKITVIVLATGGTASMVSSDTVCVQNNANVTVTTNNTHNGTIIGWQASEDGGTNWSIIGGASGSPSAFLYNFTVTTQFRAMVQNGVGCDTVYSDTVATVVVSSPTVAGTTSGNDTVCGGSNSGTVSLSGFVGDQFTWQELDINVGTWVNISPAQNSSVMNYAGLNDTTWFRCIVKSGDCPTDTSDTAKIAVRPAAIGGTVTYAGSNVCSGSSMFTLNLTGSSGIIDRWQKSINGTTWTNIPNTTNSLTDSNITADTYYRAILVALAGTCPEVPSIPDTVFVDPVSDAGSVSGNALHCDTGNTGQVIATAYVGNFDGWLLQVDGGGFGPGGSNDTINYNNLSAGVYEYRALATSGVCPQDTSATVTVTVDPSVVTGTLTGGASYCSFTNNTLLQLSGYTGVVSAWRDSVSGGSWGAAAPGYFFDTLRVTNVANPTAYRVIIASQNGACESDTSNITSILVGQSLATTVNQSDSVCISGHTGLLQLTPGYVGNIQWQDSTAGNAWSITAPADTLDTLRYTNLLETTYYRVLVQTPGCDPDTSNMVTITVNDTVFAGTLTGDMTWCDTVNSDTVLLSGYFGPIRTWQFSINGGPFVDSNKTDSALIYNNIMDSITVIRVIMDGGVCGSDTSNTVTIRQSASISGNLAAGDTICSGNNSGVLRLTGYEGSILSWDSLVPGGSYTSMNYTADSLVYNDLADTVSYRVRVQNGSCPVDTSNDVIIVVVPGTTSGMLTGARTFCATPAVDSLFLQGRVGNLLLWQFSTNNGTTWDTVQPVSTSDTLAYSISTTTWYRAIVEGSGLCPDDTSNIAMIQVGPSDAGVISGDTQLCAGSSANLMVTNYLGDIVTWESSNDSINWNGISQSDTNVIAEFVNQTTWFRVIVQSDTCDADTSIGYKVNVDQQYSGSLVTPTTSLCYGIGSDTIKLSTPLPDMVIDWEIRADTSASFTSLLNTGSFQTYDTLKITTHYRAIVKNGVCAMDTVSITLTVDTFTMMGTLIGDDTVCAGNNSGTIALENYIGNTFTWEASSDNMNWSPAPGATNDSVYTYNNLTDTTFFRVILASGGCPPDTSNSVLIVVKPAAIGGTLSSDTSFCDGPNSGTLRLTGHFGNIVGWQQSENGGPFGPVTPVNTSDSLVFTNLSVTTTYRVILSLGDCPNDTSTTATVTVLNAPTALITPDGPTEFCEGDSVLLEGSGGPAYLWTNTGDTVADVMAKTSGEYVLVVTDTATSCSDTDRVLVEVYPAANIVAAPQQTQIQQGQTVTLLATGGTSYEWSPKSTLSDAFIASPVASPDSTTTYVVMGEDSNACVGMDSALVIVIPAPTEDTSVEFSNLFTPNGDGYNDTWNITSLAQCSVCKVSIYNRYGQEIYRSENYQNDWTGTWDGSELPDGTYYYVISTETGRIYKGAITILRNK